MALVRDEPTWKVEPWVFALDPLRGAAALAVLVHHAAQAWHIADDMSRTSASAVMFGWLGSWGVVLFFVLSGFCIHLPQAQALSLDRGHTVDWPRFLKRRARRLLPTHYAALVLAAIVGSFTQTELISEPTTASFTAHIFMVHVWYGPFFFSINAVFWTIAVEVQFYLCYPVYLWLRKRLRPLGTTGLLVFTGLLIYWAASVLLRGDARSVVQHLFLVFWWQWALGAGLAEIYVKGKGGAWARSLTFPFAPAVYLVLSMAVGLKDPTILGLHIRFWLLPLVCGALLGSLVIRQCGHIPILSNAGIYSYSIYLVHPVALAALFAVRHYRDLPAIVGVPATMVLATFISWVFFLGVLSAGGKAFFVHPARNGRATSGARRPELNCRCVPPAITISKRSGKSNLRGWLPPSPGSFVISILPKTSPRMLWLPRFASGRPRASHPTPAPG
jgi:peptidoglycan/LPS O-acetylase OafA/YrhL